MVSLFVFSEIVIVCEESKAEDTMDVLFRIERQAILNCLQFINRECNHAAE